MNVYRTKFFCSCPSNNVRVEYDWTVETLDMIFVEDLLTHVGSLKPSFHEPLADELSKAWGGKQTLSANHHGVAIKTIRGRW